MILEELVVEFDPLVPGHVAQAHGDVVFGAVTEGAVGEGFGGGEGPVWVGRGGRAAERRRGPYCVLLVFVEGKEEWCLGCRDGDERAMDWFDVPPGGRSGALNGERLSRLGVFGGVRRLRRRRTRVTASQMDVMRKRMA
jgi:hypothetical protein